MLRVCAIVDSVVAIGDPISKYSQVDVILQGLLEEYNPFIMIEYSETEPLDIYDVEALLYVQ